MTSANVPMAHIGPIKISGQEVTGEINVPLATYETPLWLSVKRGAKVSRFCDHGITVAILEDKMTRSILLEAPGVLQGAKVIAQLKQDQATLAKIVEQTSRFAKLVDIHFQVTGKLIFIRFDLTCGDASGHNMVTHAAQALMDWILSTYPMLEHVSVSGNYCADKKVSAVNGILGRGKYVVAEIIVPALICERMLRTTPAQITALNIKKNLIGSINAGGVRSANAHFANILLAFYLATGQDAANIVEGSQGIVHADVVDGDLYFSVTLPNVIVGTVGHGKDLSFVQENLKALGCLAHRSEGGNARRLAAIIGAAVLCGELSLLSALTNSGELMDSHIKIERQKRLDKQVV